MPSFEQILNSPQIELTPVPGSGFSPLRVLGLICKAWNPSTPRAAKVHQVLCVYLHNILNGVSDPATRAAFCDIISGEGFDAELDGILADAISYASAEVLGTIGDATGLASSDCVVVCSVDGASVDVGNLVESVVDLAFSSFSGDGVDWGGLAAGIGEIALTQAACCVVSVGMSLASRAVVASKKINILAVMGKFRQACKELVAAEEAAEGGASGGPDPSWGPPPLAPAPGPGPGPAPESGPPVLVWRPKVDFSDVDFPSEPSVAPAPPPPPAEGSNWLPLALTIAGAGVASILIMRRGPRLRRR